MVTGAKFMGLDELRRSFERLGYTVSNSVQGQPADIWFLCPPHATPLRIGSESDLRRVLAMHERFMSKPDGRARIERWRSAKMRSAQRLRRSREATMPRRGR